MRLVLAAVGRLKEDADRALFARYWDRLAQSGRRIGIGPLRLFETAEGRAQEAAVRQADEAQRLLKGIGQASVLVALDERGRALDSAGFAGFVRARRDAGATTLAFAIGGPDGHGAALLDAAQETLSLGPMTLPHGLARIVLAEQLYRAATIIAGHPYHRA
ncbi:MAG: 23S rRNA (pseudouridine(1915)-N(3))-methyltransferase RlmH [Hyphomicrobiaceae bacterium]